jgi:acetylornithine deacetylase/succinyl-diaminopimelate desuccinylase-like protein
MNTDTTTQRVLHEVDALADRMVESLAELVRVPSVNPKYPGQDYSAVVGVAAARTSRIPVAEATPSGVPVGEESHG